MACEDEQEFGVSYWISFAAVIEVTTVKVVFVLARKWGAPAKHGGVPNAYVKASKEELDIFVRIPKLKISAEVLQRLGVTSKDQLMLELQKTLYGLKQAGRLEQISAPQAR